MPFLSDSLAGRPPRPVDSQNGRTRASPPQVVVENEDDGQQHQVREFNFASGPGAVAGRNALVILMTDDMTTQDVQQLQDAVRKRREQEATSHSNDRRGGVVINQAIGPGSIAGSNATIITSYRRSN